MSGIIKPPFGAQLNLDHPLAAGLVGCWLFNEGSGNKAHDYSGQGNVGTLINMNDPPIATSGWNAGPHGGALAFDGVNDGLIVTNNSGLQQALAFDFTVILRLKNAPNAETDARLFSKRSTNSFDIFTTTSNGWLNGYFKTAAGSTQVSYLGIILGDGLHRDIVLTRNGTTGQIKTYSNGAYKGAFETLATGNMSDAANLYIGQYGGNIRYLNGLISSVSIYNRALSAEEIAYLYAFPYCMFEIYQPWEYLFTPIWKKLAFEDDVKNFSLCVGTQ